MKEILHRARFGGIVWHRVNWRISPIWAYRFGKSASDLHFWGESNFATWQNLGFTGLGGRNLAPVQDLGKVQAGCTFGEIGQNVRFEGKFGPGAEFGSIG